MKNPYPETVIDLPSGIKGQGIRHNCWQEGYDAKEKEAQDLYEALKMIVRCERRDGSYTRYDAIAMLGLAKQTIAKWEDK